MSHSLPHAPPARLTGEIVKSGWHPFWNLDSLRTGEPAGGCRYPVRHLRYWFMDHLLRLEHVRRRQPLSILEVGVGGGHLLAYVKGASGPSHPRGLAWIASWDAASRRIDPRLKEIGYHNLVELDVERTVIPSTGPYDVLILLHLLEHLYDPEGTVARLLPLLKPGGILIGGGPTLPDWLRSVRERQLRKDVEPFGHVSVISSKRMTGLARALRLSVELMTGAYFVRMTGGAIERSELWMRLNLLFGACCPSWPGEHYWQMRKWG